MTARDLLARSPLFAAMPAAVLDALAARAVRRRVRRGTRLAGGSLVALVTGRLEVVAVGAPAGHRGSIASRSARLSGALAPLAGGEVIRSLVPPATAGVSLAVGAAATAELRAAEDSELVVVPADGVAAALRRDPQAAVAAIVHLAGVIGELSAEVEALRRHGLAARIRHRLAQLGRGRREIAITHARLADEVGGTRANVSRALARLERDGEIRRRRGVIELRP